VSETKYSYPALYMISTSKHLLSRSAANREGPAKAQLWIDERPGAQRKFTGWGLIGVKGSKPVWPIAAYREIQYIEELLPGYNYTSIEGSMGFFSNPRMEKLGADRFVLRLTKPGENRDDELLDLETDYAHVIYLPKAFVEKLREVDKQGAKAFEGLLRKAMPQTFTK
jgi:hypothetical protein